MARIRGIRPDYRTESSLCLFRDNAPSHTSLVDCRFLAKNNVCVFNHPPYSPDLAPWDYSLFPKLKMKLNRCYFEDISTLQVASKHTFQDVPQSDLQQVFDSLINRYKKYTGVQKLSITDNYVNIEGTVNQNGEKRDMRA
ncbi:mariner Mos1 transposase [Trichonephila clavipes]|nr:mariner Mos1 transposase [Trichonephila clavipes]